MGRQGRYVKVPDVGRYEGDGNIKGSNPRMRILTINIPEKYIELVDNLVKWGMIPSRSEYVRNAVKLALEDDFVFVKVIEKELEEFDPEKFVRIPNGDGTYSEKKIVRRLE